MEKLLKLIPRAFGEIDQAFVNTYETNLRHLAQQKFSKLKGKCQFVNKQSESHNWETLASMADSDVDRKADRATGPDGAGSNVLKDTPNATKNFAKRRTNVDTFDTGHSVEQEDISQMLIDPNSNLVMSQAMAMGRKVDDLVIGGMWKPASVKGAGTSVVYDDVNQKLGDGTTPISFDFVTEITEKFLQNDIEADEEKCIVIGPTQARKLLQITEATSADFVTVQALASKGIVESWMGYTWIVSTRIGKYDPTYWGLTTEDGPAEGEIFCAALTMKALGYHASKDIWTRVAEDPSASFAWRIYSAFTADCVRVEDEHLIKLHLADTL